MKMRPRRHHGIHRLPARGRQQGHTRVPRRRISDYSSRRIIDKMLLNYRSIGMIHLLFPKAAIIHLVRDPMDTLLSCYKTRFTDESSIYTLHPSTLAREYGLYLDIMRHFRQQLPPGRITDVSYTALVTQPRAALVPVLRQMRHVVQQEGGVPVELVWDEGMVQHHIAANAAMKSEGERNDDNSPSDVSKGVETLSPVSRTASYLQVKKPLQQRCGPGYATRSILGPPRGLPQVREGSAGAG